MGRLFDCCGEEANIEKLKLILWGIHSEDDSVIILLQEKKRGRYHTISCSETIEEQLEDYNPFFGIYTMPITGFVSLEDKFLILEMTKEEWINTCKVK